MSEAASADLFRLLAALAEAPQPAHADYAVALGLDAPRDMQAWRIAHTATFVENCPPYASTMVGEGGQIGGAAAERVADFRRLLGADCAEVPDALGALLADYAELVAQAAADPRAAHARAALLWEHVLSWALPYLDAVMRSAPAPYDGWARLVREVLLAEAEIVAPPDRLPLHLRAAPEPADPAEAESLKDAARRLLAPIATGVVFTRADLARAVAHVEAGLVQNSRVFMLEHLLEQEGPATLAWLAGEAEIQADSRAREAALLGDVGTFWRRRARATADALHKLAAAAGRQRGERPMTDMLRSA